MLSKTASATADGNYVGFLIRTQLIKPQKTLFTLGFFRGNC